MLFPLLCAAFFFQHVLALDQVVDLGYAKYNGKSLDNGIMRWAGMRYARNPSRQEGLRFTAPQDPVQESGISDATSFGPLCIGTRSPLTTETGGIHSEDCLFINVFAPAKATNDSKLPVYVFIQGGGFNLNGNADYNGADLIDAGDDGIVVVNFNYRVGPYGFLAGNEVVANKSLSLNNGLKDQRQAFKWVQQHIRQFGGDPDHVTIGGASAGGGSVVFHLTAYGGRNDGLFHAAAAESAAFPTLRSVKDSQWQYDELLKQTGCSDINCMATMDTVKFQEAVRTLKKPFPGGVDPPLFFWNPTLDYDLIQDYTTTQLKAGRYIDVPTIFGSTTHDGVIFTPKNVVSLSRAQSFLLDQFPSIKWDALKEAWGTKAVTATSSDDGWRALAADMYGSIRYGCPGLSISATYARNKTIPTWHYRWNVGSALHVAELGPIWNNATSAAGVFVQAYWASFIRSYDPNKHAAEFLVAKGSELRSPQWESFDASNGKRIVFSDDNKVHMEEVNPVEQKRCEAIDNMGIHLNQPTKEPLTSPTNNTTDPSSSSDSPASPSQHSFGSQSAPLSLAYLLSSTITLVLLHWMVN